MPDMYQRFVIDVNPIPWRVPPFTVGRGKNKGAYVVAGRDAELHAYEEAVRSEVEAQEGWLMPGPYFIQLWFSRSLANGANAADVTNLQKSTEDALQGAVIVNDTDTVEIFSHRLLQADTAPGFVIIEIWGEHKMNVPTWVTWIVSDKVTNSAELNPGDNEWPPRS